MWGYQNTPAYQTYQQNFSRAVNPCGSLTAVWSRFLGQDDLHTTVRLYQIRIPLLFLLQPAVYTRARELAAASTLHHLSVPVISRKRSKT